MSLLEIQDGPDQKLPDQDPLARYKKPGSRLPVLLWGLGLMAACIICVCACVFSLSPALAWVYSNDCQAELGLSKERCDAWARDIVDNHMAEISACADQVEADVGTRDFALIAACLDEQGIGPNSK